MKLDNKGFAISGILYAVMILFLTIIFSLLALISNRKLVLDKYKREVKELINNSEETFGARIQLANNTLSVRMSENELGTYDFTKDVAACLNANITGTKNVLCRNNEIDISSILAYRIYDEVGNKVKFNIGEVTSSDNYKVNIVTYSYYDKDANGNYMLDATNTALKTTTKSLSLDKDNKFYVKYSVADNNNILSKEVTRTLVVNKYNNYINLLDNYYSIPLDQIATFDFKTKANNYNYSSNTLTKSNSSLNYTLYSPTNEIITSFSVENEKAYYTTSSGKKLVGSGEMFKIKYYTGTLSSPTSQVVTAYYSVKQKLD